MTQTLLRQFLAYRDAVLSSLLNAHAVGPAHLPCHLADHGKGRPIPLPWI